MKAKYPEPDKMIECWRGKRWNLPIHQGTAWYRIADSHLSPGKSKREEGRTGMRQVRIKIQLIKKDSD
jgi:hypothetical protein